MKQRKNLIWIAVAVLLMVFTFRTVLKMSDSLSLPKLFRELRGANPLFLALALAAMLCFIALEGEALLLILRSFGFRPGHGSGLLYSAGDIYFSAITPSASGGQPASAWFMLRDGIPGAVVTVTLLVNLIAYTAATLTAGILALLIWPGAITALGALPKLLIGVGMAALVGLIFLFYFLLHSGERVYRIGAGFLGLLRRLRLLRDDTRTLERLRGMVDEYQDCAFAVRGKTGMAVGVYLLDLGQRAAQISVAALVHLSLGGGAAGLGRIWAGSALSQIGSGCLPVPGGMGVADYLLIECFELLFPREQALRLELLSRSLSFYLCMIFSGLISLFGYLAARHRKGLQ